MQTDDLRSALLFITAKYPKAPLIGLGFSLGANIITKYLGEEEEKSLLRAAVVLACVSSLFCEGMPKYSTNFPRPLALGPQEEQR